MGGEEEPWGCSVVCQLITKPFQQVWHTSSHLTNNANPPDSCMTLQQLNAFQCKPPYLLSPSRRWCLTVSHLTITSFISSFIIKSWYQVDLKRVCTLDDSTESKVKEPWQVRVGAFALFLQISEVSRRGPRECKGSEQRCDWKPIPWGSSVLA